MQSLCAQMWEEKEQLDDLDTQRYLEQMARMEQEGARFVNIRKRDTLAKYAAPVAAALLFVALMVGVLSLCIWTYLTHPEEVPPLAVIVTLAAIPAVAVLGVLIALIQRLKQIRGGEEDAAAQY